MKIVIRSARWKYFIILLGSLAFVVSGVSMLVIWSSGRHEFLNNPIIGWSSIIFFGACALVAAWQFIDSRPRLIIDDEGILDRTLGIGYIPWSDIQGAYLRSISKQDFICLELRNSELYLQRSNSVKRALANTNAALGFTPISLNLSCIAAESNDLLELIIKRIHEPTGNT